MPDEDLERLKARCVLSTKLWGRTFAGLTAMTYRERGSDDLHSLWFKVLTGHQVGHYGAGLEKLGIHNDPPAVAAAKYHYYTNLIGGLDMEYVEESPKKAWIRYLAPMWTYGGIALLALPGTVRRTIFSSWHPRNGKLMGCPRLGYVGTKFIMEGDPYDEGYFMEYDHDLAPEEIMRYETVEHTPEFDPATAPRLDPAAWPEARLVKAQRNFSSGYVNTTIKVLLGMVGESVTYHILGQTMRCLAIQYTHELKRDLGIEGKGAGDVAALFAGLLDACFQELELERVTDAHHRIVLRSYKPFEDFAPERLRTASFAFQEMVARLINGRLAVTRTRESEGGAPGAEVWDIVDTGRWRF